MVNTNGNLDNLEQVENNSIQSNRAFTNGDTHITVNTQNTDGQQIGRQIRHELHLASLGF